MNVTQHDIMTALADLTAAYGAPFDAQTDAGIKKKADVWHRALHDLESHDFKQATSDLIRDRPAGSKWPAPADLRKPCLAARQRRTQIRLHAAAAADNDIPFCAHCHTWDLYVNAFGRLAPLHSLTCPMLAGSTEELQRQAMLRDAPVWLRGADPQGLA